MSDVSISRHDFLAPETSDDGHLHAETSYYVAGDATFGGGTLAPFNDGVITWSIGTANFSQREPFDASVSVLPFDATGVIASAFATWASVANLEFEQVADSRSVDIRFGMGDIDGQSETLAYTLTVSQGTSTLFSDIVFDLAETFSVTGIGTPVNFYLVVLHEIGHALGLGHEDDVAAVMNSLLNESLSGLTADDIAGIQSLYGAPGGSPPQPLPVQPPITPVTTPPPVPWTPPGDTGSGFSSLIDDLFYFASNPDVAVAGIHPLDHYLAFGWKEGRNPNPLFDTGFYLDSNPDVTAAGINPLQHYAEYGWREGRDPSLSFDGDKYLQANPDVALIGMDPLAHYLLYGEAEGRAIYPVGPVGA